MQASVGRFITVEGGEGVGKSHFTANLAKALADAGRTVLTTREPGGTPVADAIRGLFASPPAGEALTMETEALLVSAARAQHVARKIKPALAGGSWVLCDRFADSMRVYQGALGGVPSEALEALIAFSTAGTAPDVTFLLDCDVKTALSRLARRSPARGDSVERYDQAQSSVHQKLRDAYLALMAREPRRFVKIDAASAPEAMIAQAKHALEDRFGRL